MKMLHFTWGGIVLWITILPVSYRVRTYSIGFPITTDRRRWLDKYGNSDWTANTESKKSEKIDAGVSGRFAPCCAGDGFPMGNRESDAPDGLYFEDEGAVQQNWTSGTAGLGATDGCGILSAGWMPDDGGWISLRPLQVQPAGPFCLRQQNRGSARRAGGAARAYRIWRAAGFW